MNSLDKYNKRYEPNSENRELEFAAGPGGRIRTYEGINPPDLQSGAIGHSATPGNTNILRYYSEYFFMKQRNLDPKFSLLGTFALL